MSDVRICFSTCPDAEVATRLARGLVAARVAACVNIVPNVTSVYRWQEEIQQDAEVLLIIKTTADAYAAVETYLHAEHPYELPELIAVSVEQGLSPYLAWIIDAIS